MKLNQIVIRNIPLNLAAEDLDNPAWISAPLIVVDKYWSGDPAPSTRQLEARLLWSNAALHIRFDATQNEPLVVSDDPNLATKTVGLWDRDTCEVFIAPDANRPNRYFEFEVAPTGEWIDLAIEAGPEGRITDFEYASGISVFARIEEGRVLMAMRIPWEAFESRPKIGDIWLGNIFRCIGSGETRGYLAWQPTMTERPNFHVPEKFGELCFMSEPPA